MPFPLAPLWLASLVVSVRRALPDPGAFPYPPHPTPRNQAPRGREVELGWPLGLLTFGPGLYPFLPLAGGETEVRRGSTSLRCSVRQEVRQEGLSWSVFSALSCFLFPRAGCFPS